MAAASLLPFDDDDMTFLLLFRCTLCFVFHLVGILKGISSMRRAISLAFSEWKAKVRLVESTTLFEGENRL